MFIVGRYNTGSKAWEFGHCCGWSTNPEEADRYDRSAIREDWLPTVCAYDATPESRRECLIPIGVARELAGMGPHSIVADEPVT